MWLLETEPEFSGRAAGALRCLSHLFNHPTPLFSFRSLLIFITLSDAGIKNVLYYACSTLLSLALSFLERQCWELNLGLTHTGQHFIGEVFLLSPVALFLGSEHGRKRA